MTFLNNNDALLEHLTTLKRQAEQVGRILLSNPLTESAGKRILECAEQVLITPRDQFKTKPITFYCQHRQCPICQWRRSDRARAKMHGLFDVNPGLADGKWLFLTLTARNCQTWNLRETLKRRAKAFKRLTRRKFWRENVLGAIRYTEVDVGQEEPDTAHPHFHCLLLVRPSMFEGKNYLSEERWRDAWGQALQEGYLPRLEVKRLQGTPDQIRSQVVAVSGYSTKARAGVPDASPDFS
ncbi:protein rep [Marinobacter shengliensis]|uniref:protein rep n=1 Tax=Marinobacter shengliensis TaxID=1389223 RepID=UPI0011085EAE